jgi:Uma2 family endonuclease
MTATLDRPRPKPKATAAREWPIPFRWTSDLFHEVTDSGFFEGRSVILVDGEIWDMPGPNPPHEMATMLADYKFKALFAEGHVVRVQMSLILGINTDPIPDLAVIEGSPRDFVTHPKTAKLVVEISESTLAYDLGLKSTLYAAAEIADYWVVDLVNRKLVVHRNPQLVPDQPHGHAYAEVKEYGPDDTVSPLAAPGGVVKVSELLP